MGWSMCVGYGCACVEGVCEDVWWGCVCMCGGDGVGDGCM